MSASDLIKELLPTAAARTSASLTLACTPIAWAIPHWASTALPTATQAEILLAQAAAALLILAMGSFATLIFVTASHKAISSEIKGLQEIVSKMPEGKSPDDVSVRLSNDMESMLQYVVTNPGQSIRKISKSMHISEPSAYFLLEELEHRSYAKRYRGLDENNRMRQVWNCDTIGRKYLAFHNLLQ